MVNKKRITDEFCKLVHIDSVSFQERKIADVLIHYLEELGFTIKEDKAGEYYSGSCGNIYGFLQGGLKGDSILFSSHMDTVEPGIHKTPIVQEDGTITSDGNTVLGADDISGIVSILEALRTIKEQGIPHRNIEVLFTIAEEVHLKGSEVFDYNQIQSKEAYILDLSGPVGTAALEAPTLYYFTAEIIGKSSHAGFAPEQGIHAIAIAAEAITEIRQGKIDENTTVNIGSIEGGKASNIIPDLCILTGEVRSLNHEHALAEAEKIKEILGRKTARYHARLKFDMTQRSLAFKIDPNNHVVKQFGKVCEELGYNTEFICTFGCSDNNNFMKHGITGIVMACAMNEVHSCREFTQIDELVKCSNIILKLMTSEVNEC